MTNHKEQKTLEQRSWFNFQNILFVIFVIIFLVTVIWSEQLGGWVEEMSIEAATTTPIPTSLLSNATEIPF